MIATVIPTGESFNDSAIYPMPPSLHLSDMATNKPDIPVGVAGLFYFETPVTIDGDTAMIGAFRSDTPPNLHWAGSVYVFSCRNHIWRKQQRIYSPDTDDASTFGWSVSVSGDTAVFGAPYQLLKASPGCAYVYTRTGIRWRYQAKLLASDGVDGDLFGTSVSVDGDTALIGAYGNDDNGNWSGSAYVFTRTGTTWTQKAKLLPSDNAAEDNFGASVSLAGDIALIGAPSQDDKGMDSGSAYVFIRTGSNWTQQAKLLASDGANYDQFGTSIALDGENALIGAVDFDWYTYHTTGPGSAYVFTRTGTTWTQQAKLLAADGEKGDRFGYSVSLSGDRALIGAYRDWNGDYLGSAYIFTRTDTTWIQQQKLQVYRRVSKCLGISVALADNTAVISSYYSGDTYTHSSAYGFTRIGKIWIKQTQLLGLL